MRSDAFRAAAEAKDFAAARELFAEDVVFRSPVVFKPYEGRDALLLILGAVVQVFEDFRYVEQVETGDTAMLMFEARVGDAVLQGIDILRFGEDGRIARADRDGAADERHARARRAHARAARGRRGHLIARPTSSSAAPRSRTRTEMAETAIAAWRQGFRGIVPDDVDPGRSWRPERLGERLHSPSIESGEILVAEVGEVRQRASSSSAPAATPARLPTKGEVIALYVHPDHWRSGVGARLVDAALERLRTAGIAEAIVWTLAESPRNLAIYESLGFRRDGGEQRRESFGSPLEVRFRMSL